MTTVAVLPAFGGGVVLAAAPDQRRTDELAAADGYDIGPRGALIAARDVSDYTTLLDNGPALAAWSKLYALRSVADVDSVRELAVGEGVDSSNVLAYLADRFGRYTGPTNELRVVGAPYLGGGGSTQPAPVTQGVVVTVVPFSGQFAIWDTGASAIKYVTAWLVNIGAREGFQGNTAPGLYVAYTYPGASAMTLLAIDYFDALGTGPQGMLKVDHGTTGTKALPLRFRGIAAYNSILFGWGFDATALRAAGNYTAQSEGPARLMFSRPGNPLIWGNDDQDVDTANRMFSDTDAIAVGDGGENIRGALAWNGRLWIGTDRKLHYIAGNGRLTFLTDTARPVSQSENILGPNAMCEGPDGRLYGFGSSGLWAFDGETFDASVRRRLRDSSDASPGYWDLIWADQSFGDAYPGKTNSDLVWCIADWDHEQVVVGIPWCNARAGSGYGVDTVLVKFSTKTGGFARQVFENRQYTAADYPRAERQVPGTRFVGTATSGEATVQRYGERFASEGQIASPAPAVDIGPLPLFGPNGVGVYRRSYLTLGWEESPEVVGTDWRLQIPPSTGLPTIALASAVWSRTSASREIMTLTFSGADAARPVRVWRKIDAGAFAHVADITAGDSTYAYVLTSGSEGEHSLSFYLDQLDGVTPGTASNTVVSWGGPIAPTGVVQTNVSDLYFYNLQWNTPPVGAKTRVYDDYLCLHVYVNRYLSAVNATTGTVPDPNPGGGPGTLAEIIHAQLRHEITQFSVTDVSDWTSINADELIYNTDVIFRSCP